MARPLLLAHRHVQRVMDALQGAVPVPELEIVVHRVLLFILRWGLLRSKRVRNPFRIRRMAIAVKTRSHSVRRPRRLTTSRLLFRSESAYHTRKFGVSPVHHAAPRRRGRSRCAGRSTVPDLRTLFINVQHPGELPLEHPPRNDPKNPKAASSEAAAMNADSIQYALETDWPVGAAGFEPLHIRIGICQDSQPGGRDSNLRISNRAALLTNLSGARSTPTSR